MTATADVGDPKVVARAKAAAERRAISRTIGAVDWRDVAKIKRGVCRRLRRLIGPLTWHTAYEGVRIFSFKQAGMGEHYKVRNALAMEYSDAGIDMFYQDGLVPGAYGGGCVTVVFESVGVEDLLRIELLVRRLYPRMKAGSEAFKKSLKKQASVKAAEEAQ